MSNRESTTLTIETTIEALILPLMFVMPFAVFREIFLFFQGKLNPKEIGIYIVAATLVAAAAAYFPFVVKNADGTKRQPDKILFSIALFNANAITFIVSFLFLHLKKPYDFLANFERDTEAITKFWTILIILYVLSVVINFIILRMDQKNMSDPDRPLVRPMLVFYIQTLAASLYYVIFRSFESFRLPQQTMMQIGLSFIFVLLIISWSLKGQMELRRHPFNIPIMLMTALSLFSFVWSPNIMISVKEFTQYFFIVLNFYLLIHIFNPRKHLNAFIISFLVIMFIEAAIGFWQLKGLNEIINLTKNFDPFSTLGNKNYVAELLAVAIPFAIAIAVCSKNIVSKIMTWIAIEAMLVVTLYSLARGAWMGVIVSSIVLFMFSIDRLRKAKAAEMVLYIGMLVISGIVIMILGTNGIGLPKPLMSFSSRFMSIIYIMKDVAHHYPVFWLAYLALFGGISTGVFFLLKRKEGKIGAIILIGLTMLLPAMLTFSGRAERGGQKQTIDLKGADVTEKIRLEDSISSRKFIWGGTFEMIRHNPMGVGLGAYKVKYLGELKSYLAHSGIQNIPGFFKDVNAKEAHSEYLHIWAEMGPLALVFFAYIAFTVFSYFKKTFYRAEDTKVRSVALGAFASIVSVSVSAILGFPFHIIATALFSGLMMAILVFSHDLAFNLGVVPREVVVERPEPKQAGKKKNKKQKIKEKQEEQASAETPEVEEDNNEEETRKHWKVFRLNAAVVPVLVIFAVFAFYVVTLNSYKWQRANIDVKAGNFLAQQGNVNAAKMFYNTSLEMDPYNGDIHLFMGMFLQRLKKNERALEEFKEARRYYDLPQISLDMCAIYFEKGRDFYDEAEVACKDSLGIYPNYPLPRYNVGLIYYQRGVEILEDPAKTQNPDEAKRNDYLQEALKQLDAAREMFSIAVDINPRLDTSSFKLALTYEKLNQLDPVKYPIDEAIRWYRRTLGINRQHADAYYNLGLLLTKKASQVNTQADNLLKAGRSEDAKVLYASGTQLMKESGELFDQAIKFNPNHFKAYNNRANQLFNEGRVEAALEMYQMAVKTNPNYLNARLNIALALMHLKRFDESIEQLNLLLQQNLAPQHELKVKYMLGTCYDSLGDTQKAYLILAEPFSKYKTTNYRMTVEFASLTIMLAQVKDKLGETPKAIQLIEMVLHNNMPAFQEVEARFYLANYQRKIGETQKAKALYENIVARFQGSPFAKQAQEILNQMQ